MKTTRFSFRFPVILSALSAGLFLCSGCVMEGEDIFARSSSPMRAVNVEAAKQAANQQMVEANVQRLLVQMDEIRRSQEQQESRLAALENQLKNTGGVRDEITALRRDIETVRGGNAALRKEIVDDLSGRMAQIQRAAPKAPDKPAAKAGYEHKVEKGQTLSEIAKGYNTTVSAIMKANNLTSKSIIRVGQTLFIPD